MVRIKAIIFDLDNCLFDTRSMGKDLITPVLEPLLAASVAHEDVDRISQALWVKGLEDVVREFGISPLVAEGMRTAYTHLQVPLSARTYGDEEVILELPGRKILVTTGYRKFQEAKIKALGIRRLFDEVVIDAYEDQPRKCKKLIFKELLLRHGWLPFDVAVVGDSGPSELTAAKELGIQAIQTLRPGIVKWSEANAYISSLAELWGMLK